MKFFETSKKFTLNKSTYVNLRWIAYIGQIISIFVVQFYFEFSFNYLPCLIIIFLSIISNLYLQFKIQENQLNNITASLYLIFDIIQLTVLFFFTGGITNPFIFLLIIPAVFSSQYLNKSSSIILVFITSLTLFFLTFFYFDLPHPDELHFHTPDYYLYSIPIAIFIGLNFLVYFGFKFGNENRIRTEAYDKMQEIMAKENELVSLGGQAAAAAHSLGTPLSTILLTAKELQKDYASDIKIKSDLDLLVSQSNRCSEILKKLTLNPIVEDEFIDNQASLKDYIEEIIRSYQEISEKKFVLILDEDKNPLKSYKSQEVVYGLRNFIGNANKFSINKVEILIKSNNKISEVVVRDDGPGFPKDLIDKHKLGEPYIRTSDNAHISKYGLGLGTFIGKTLLEKNFAEIHFTNLEKNKGAEVSIKWNNKDFIKI
tara:strand:- start:2081 stop:3367 length:1287 start_codon:yes stop_codon:yes gene_type:complete